MSKTHIELYMPKRVQAMNKRLVASMEERIALYQLHVEGASREDLADMSGFSATTIHRYITEAHKQINPESNIVKPNGRRVATEADKQNVCDLFKAGKSYKEIIETTKFAHSTVSRFLRNGRIADEAEATGTKHIDKALEEEKTNADKYEVLDKETTDMFKTEPEKTLAPIEDLAGYQLIETHELVKLREDSVNLAKFRALLSI
jgi:DNA invertase Pin-like site-specific DNA recombinase